MKLVEYSSLFFLTKLRKRQFRWLKLRDIILLLLRTLIIAFLVLAVSKPFWQGSAALGKIFGDVVLIIDDSFSTEPCFNDLKSSAKRILKELASGSRVAIYTPSAEIWSSDWSSAENALDSLNKLKYSMTARSLFSSWQAGLRMLSSSKSRTKRIIVLSDGQKRAVEFMQRVKIPDEVEVICFFDNSHWPSNTSIQKIDIYPFASLAGENQKLRIDLLHSGKERQNTISLTIDGLSVGKHNITLSEGRKTLKTDIPANGVELKVVLAEDSISSDNTRFALKRGDRKIKVFLVGEQASSYLKLALGAFPAFEIERINRFKAASLTPSDCDLLIWDGLSMAAGNVYAAAANGVPVLVLLDTMMASDFSEAFAVKAFRNEGFTLLNSSSELISDLKLQDIEAMRVNNFLELNPRNCVTILSLSQGEPFLLADTRYPVFYIPLRFTPTNTDMVYKGIFPVFLQKIIAYVLDRKADFEYYVGDTIELRRKSNLPVSIETPKLRYEITPIREGSDFILRMANIKQAGIYKIDNKPFVVNINPQESQLTKIDPSFLTKRGIEVYSLSASVPRRLWLAALIAAALCFVAELALILI